MLSPKLAAVSALLCGTIVFAAAAPEIPRSPPASARQRAAPLPPRRTPLPAQADAAGDVARQRCANRLAIAMTGYPADDTLLAASDPQSEVQRLLDSADFKEHFARFINASFNVAPGAFTEDGVYVVLRFILDKPERRSWSELFVGPYNFDATIPGDPTSRQAFDDPEGLGYFRSRYWVDRYRGNETEQGLRLGSAYRILQNTLGLVLVPSTNAPGADLTAAGRSQAPCSGCHFDGPLPLDPIASLLTRRRIGSSGALTDGYVPPPAGVAFTVDGATVHDEAELLHLLVASPQFQFNACRLAFEFLYGRAEHVCEGPLFDRCMDAFAPAGSRIEDGQIQDALAAIATDASFCQ